MLRNLSGRIAIAAFLLFTTATFAAPVHGKGHAVRRWHGYGFLPGYRSPERIEWERAQNRGPVYWYGGPGFYRGAGPVVASVHAGHRRRLGMYGTAVDEPPSSVGRVGPRVMRRQFT